MSKKQGVGMWTEFMWFSMERQILVNMRMNFGVLQKVGKILPS
jgi:hypothetical protein